MLQLLQHVKFVLLVHFSQQLDSMIAHCAQSDNTKMILRQQYANHASPDSYNLMLANHLAYHVLSDNIRMIQNKHPVTHAHRVLFKIQQVRASA